MTTGVLPSVRVAAACAGWPRVAPVPGGRFRMGSERGRPDERPARTAYVSAFELALTPVTCGQYARFVLATGAASPPCFAQPDFHDPEQPVTSVTWFEAVAFAEWLTTVAGGRWRLPSEAEWERAARGGLEGAATAWGDALPAGEVPAEALSGPWRVGCGQPNAYGLFDMGTIVHEWCLDWYAADAAAGALERDPRGPAEGTRRASRGGSWRHRVRWSPPSARSSLPPEFRYADYGFRVLKEVHDARAAAIGARLERRRAARIPMPPRGGAVTVVGARLLNVSRCGMLIESPLPMARDEVLRLCVLLAGQPADLEARVAACRPQPGRRGYAVGLEFTSLAPSDRERLERALEVQTGDRSS